MSLNSLISYIANTQITTELIKRIYDKKQINLIGSSRYSKSILIESIANSLNKDVLLLCPNTEIAYKWVGYFESNENNNILYYPPNEYLPYETRTKSREVEYSQLNIINHLINGLNKNKIIISTERSLQPHLLGKEFYVKNNMNIKKGQRIEIEDLARNLTELGYKKENITSFEGNWSRRGDIVDIFPVNNELPIRIEFYDNIIEKIREFDPYNQKTLDTINQIYLSQVGSYQKIIKELQKLSKNGEFRDGSNNQKNLDRFLGLVDNKLSSLIKH